ncbi:MAG: TIGR02530 family flagellar biosynthesis protein [Velocimicrobium sp.]
MKIQNNFVSIERMVGQISTTQTENLNVKTNDLNASDLHSFEEVLEKTKESSEKETKDILKFSKHANQRLESRNIDLSQSQLKRLITGTQKARDKGINESLVMVDNLAFIVNVKNNTVVTAVNDAKNSIFTNIDGAVIG